MLLRSKQTVPQKQVGARPRTDKSTYVDTRGIHGGWNNTVVLLRGRPQSCGHMQEMLALYMFIGLPWKNKRLSHRHFLGSSPRSPLQACVGEKG